jgi:hypothetical protein
VAIRARVRRVLGAERLVAGAHEVHAVAEVLGLVAAAAEHVGHHAIATHEGAVHRMGVALKNAEPE